jgi:hypothetical protein
LRVAVTGEVFDPAKAVITITTSEVIIKILFVMFDKIKVVCHFDPTKLLHIKAPHNSISV